MDVIVLFGLEDKREKPLLLGVFSKEELARKCANDFVEKSDERECIFEYLMLDERNKDL